MATASARGPLNRRNAGRGPSVEFKPGKYQSRKVPAYEQRCNALNCVPAVPIRPSRPLERAVQSE